MPDYIPKRHILDKRADDVLAKDAESDGDELLTTRQVAAWLGTSRQFLTIGRHRGYGPKFIKPNAAAVRYRRSDVREWLRERTFQSTAEFAASRSAEK